MHRTYSISMQSANLPPERWRRYGLTSESITSQRVYGEAGEWLISAFSGACDIYNRYVDGIFCVVDGSMDIDNLLSIANKAYRNIQFTVELETDDGAPFLDVALSRGPEGTLRRAIHRKLTCNGQYTHFLSFVPIRNERNLVECLASRAHVCAQGTYSTQSLTIYARYCPGMDMLTDFRTKTWNSQFRK